MKFIRLMTVAFCFSLVVVVLTFGDLRAGETIHKVYDKNNNEIECSVYVSSKTKYGIWAEVKLNYRIKDSYIKVKCKHNGLNAKVVDAVVDPTAMSTYTCESGNQYSSPGLHANYTDRRVTLAPGTMNAEWQFCQNARHAHQIHVIK